MTNASHDEPVMVAAKPDKPPLKTNIYQYAQMSGTQLLPLFPYHGPGDIVPTCASMRSSPGGPGIGYFLHVNSVDEVMVSFGSTGDIRSGDVNVGAKKHGVGGWGERGEFFAVMSITQRQLESGAQNEEVGFACEKCNHVIANLEFSGTPDSDEQRVVPPLPTIDGSARSARAFNTSEESRTCGACGHVNQPFPAYIWGWDRYMFNTEVAEAAHMALREAAKS